MNLPEIVVTAVEHKGELTQSLGLAAASAVALCAFIARFMPPATKPGFYANLRGVVNWIAQNKDWARNAH